MTQLEAVQLLSLEVLLRYGFKPGPKTRATLEKYRDDPTLANGNPMSTAIKTYSRRG